MGKPYRPGMLLQRNGVWTYRRVVPPECRPLMGVRREVWRSLKTADLETAKLRAMEVALEVERDIQDAKRRLALRRGALPTPEGLAQDWQRRELEANVSWRAESRAKGDGAALDAEIEALGNALEDNADALNTGDTRLEMGLLRELLQPFGVTVSAKDRARFAQALLKARLHFIETSLHRAQAEATGGGVSAENPMLSDVLEAWLKARRPPSKTEAEWRSVFRRFEAVNGVLAVRSVGKAHIRAFRESFAATPSKRSKDGKVSPVTVRKGLSVLSSVFRWAVREGYIDNAPTEGITGVRGSKTRDRERARLPYSSADLALILRSLPSEADSPSKHWLPQVAQWTGARIEELAQLRLEDVGHEEGVWFIHVRGGEGRSVKTYSANRRIPIHHELARAGFLDFVERQRSRGQNAMMFSDLKRGPHGKYSAAYSKYWGRWTDSIGITNPRLTFHSFRHGFASACRRAGMPLPIQETLMGHSSGRVSERYGDPHPLPVLAEWMGKIGFPAAQEGS